MKAILTILLSFGLVVSLFGQTRNVVVGTNGVVVQPTNFWSANVTNARSGLGLDSAATNPASAFQPSSTVLSNLASSNAVNITNLRATNIVGTVALASNVSGIISIANGGTGATNAATARTNLNVQQASVVLSNLANSNGSDLTNITISSLGTIAISNGGTGATNAATARTNLGLGWPVFTNTNFASALLGTKTSESSSGPPTFYTTVEVVGYTNGLVFTNANIRFGGMQPTNVSGPPSKTDVDFYGNVELSPFDNGGGGEDSPVITVGSASAEYVYISGSGVSFSNGSAATTRTNLGLGAGWLTNTNNPVFVGTNGEVVSPTNFWQVAPIQTLVQDLTAIVTSQTNNATNARNVYIYSLATNVSGISNTIILPTNTSTLNGDEVCVVHRGTTNTTTVVRQAGSTNNLITLNRFDEAVKFIRELGQWDFYHNISFVEPIQFSGTNVSANAAASVTNLFTPNTPLVFTTNGQVVYGGTNALTFTNRPLIKGLNTTNIPAIQWDTSDGKGLGSVFVLSKGAATNLWDSPTNAHTNWSILFFGQNIAPNASGTDVSHPTQSMGSSYLTMENNYNFDGVAGAPASETYFVTRDTNNVLTRTFQIFGSQTNSTYGSVNMNYRLAVEPATATIENTGSPFVVRYSHPSAGNLAHAFLWNPDTNASRDVRFNMAVGNSPTAIMSVEPAKYFLFRANYGYAFIARTNGIVIGSTGDVSPQERVHLAGNTRIDGAISFNATSNAATTRTNLELGLPALTNTSNATFQEAIFTTNAAPTNPTTPNFGDHAAWMGVSIVTNGVTNVFRIPLYK